MGAGVAGAAGSAASGAGGAGGAIGQAVSSGLAATVSAITGVVSAVTGVISVFQQARQENTLNAIEQNTRDSAFYLGGNNSLGGILQAVYHMDENLQYGYMAKDVRDIHDKFMGTGPAQSDPNADLLKAIGNLDTDLQYGFMSKNVLDIRNKIMTFADGGGGSMSMRGNVYLDSKELFSSFVSWAEDNGLVVPQS
jgi:hypothetical protein